MKTKLVRLLHRLRELRDEADDDELIENLDSAILHLEAAGDRLVALEEEEPDDEWEEEEPIPGDPESSNI